LPILKTSPNTGCDVPCFTLSSHSYQLPWFDPHGKSVGISIHSGWSHHSCGPIASCLSRGIDNPLAFDQIGFNMLLNIPSLLPCFTMSDNPKYLPRFDPKWKILLMSMYTRCSYYVSKLSPPYPSCQKDSPFESKTHFLKVPTYSPFFTLFHCEQ
jgi:hypothetical protein